MYVRCFCFHESLVSLLVSDTILFTFSFYYSLCIVYISICTFCIFFSVVCLVFMGSITQSAAHKMIDQKYFLSNERTSIVACEMWVCMSSHQFCNIFSANSFVDHFICHWWSGFYSFDFIEKYIRYHNMCVICFSFGCGFHVHV